MIRFLTPVVLCMTLCGMWAGWPSTPAPAQAGSQNSAVRLRTASAANTNVPDSGSLVGREISFPNKANARPQAEPVNSREPGEWVAFTATAYCSCKKCCGRNACGITASGHKLRLGDHVIAVDPRVIPLRSLVEVAGMGRFHALDTGSAIKGNRIDIWMHSHHEALEFGRRTVQLRVLELGRKTSTSVHTNRPAY